VTSGKGPTASFICSPTKNRAHFFESNPLTEILFVRFRIPLPVERRMQ
jgi:hypothetical protein